MLKKKVLGAEWAVSLNSREKLEFLQVHDQLPLPTHQEYGSCFCRTKVEREAVHPLTNEPIVYFRSVVVPVKGNIRNYLTEDGIDYQSHLAL